MNGEALAVRDRPRGVNAPGAEAEQGLELSDLDPLTAPLWEAGDLAFQRYDTSLVFGENWWPVDEDLAENPGYFSVRWTAWLRALSSGDVVLALGATTDGWVLLDDQVIASVEATETFAPENQTVSIRSGVYPLDVRMTHRGGGEAGFRFWVVSGSVAICYPEFGAEE